MNEVSEIAVRMKASGLSADFVDLAVEYAAEYEGGCDLMLLWQEADAEEKQQIQKDLENLIDERLTRAFFGRAGIKSALSLCDAVGVVSVIVDMLPEAGELSVRGGLLHALRTWPETRWGLVSAGLRSGGLDAWKIADWLDEERKREEARIASIA